MPLPSAPKNLGMLYGYYVQGGGNWFLRVQPYRRDFAIRSFYPFAFLIPLLSSPHVNMSPASVLCVLFCPDSLELLRLHLDGFVDHLQWRSDKSLPMLSHRLPHVWRRRSSSLYTYPRIPFTLQPFSIYVYFYRFPATTDQIHLCLKVSDQIERL